MNWLQMLQAAGKAANTMRSVMGGNRQDDGGGASRLVLIGGLGCLALPLIGVVMIIAVIGGVVAVAVEPFSLFFGAQPQSVPPDGLGGPAATYWSTFVEAQAEYKIPMPSLLALAEMTSGFKADYTAPDGNAGLIAMPPALFLSTATAHQIPLDTCTATAKGSTCSTPPTQQAMFTPTIEILVAAAALSDAKFSETTGTITLPDKVGTAIKPFMCGTDPTCDTNAFTNQLITTMDEYYQWLQTSPAGGAWAAISSKGDAWNQAQIGTFPLPPPTSRDPFPYAQCTWWAYYEDPVPGVHGNADQWASEAAAAGDTVIPTGFGPAAGDVVVFNPGGGYGPTAGHVAYVVAVQVNAAGAVDEYEISQANVPTGTALGSYADIPWPDPHVLAFLPPAGEWKNPLSTFAQGG